MAEVTGFWELAEQLDSREERTQDTRVGVVTQIAADGTVYVHFDGGVDEMPVHQCYFSVEPGDAVPVTIAKGRATIGGNASNLPASSAGLALLRADTNGTFSGVFDTIAAHEGRFDNIEADTGYIKDLKADSITTDDIKASTGYIKDLKADNIEVETISANVGKIKDISGESLSYATGYIGELKSKNITTDNIDAATGYIGSLVSNDITANDIVAAHEAVESLDATYAKIETLESDYAHITNGVIDNAKIGYADVNALDAHYAEIDLANVNNAWIEHGVVKDAAISDAQIIGVSANKLTAGTIDAAKINVANLRAKNLIVEKLNGQPVLGGYELVSQNSSGYAQKNPSQEGWYEYSNGAWSASTDTVVDMSKAYYRDGEDVALYDQAYIDGMERTLNQRIDGAVETFTGTEVPSLVNYPAADWSASEYDSHVGDIYYVVNAGAQADGYSYRFTKMGTGSSATYDWTLIRDSDITKALQDILDINGALDIDSIIASDYTVYSFMTHTDGELSNLQTAQSSMETALGTKVSTETFNEVKQAVDENSMTITSMSETLETKADSSTVTTLSNTVNSVKETADANTLSITNLTKTVSDNKTSIEARASSIEQNLNGITTRVAKTEADFDGLQIGGRNLLLGTSDMSNWGHTNGTTIADGVVTFPTVTTATWREIYPAKNFRYVLIRNQTVTFSAKVKADAGASCSLNLCIGVDTTETAYGRKKYRNQQITFTGSGTWERVSVTADVTDSWFNAGSGTVDFDDCWVTVRPGAWGTVAYGTGFELKELMLELSTKPSDYSPASEDIESRVTQDETKITQTAEAIGLTASGGATIANPNLSPYFEYLPLTNKSAGSPYWYYLNDFTAMEDGWAKGVKDNSSGSSNTYINMREQAIDALKPSTTYTAMLEVRNYSGSGTTSWVIPHRTDTGQVSSFAAPKSVAINKNGVYRLTLTSLADLSGVTEGCSAYIQVNAGAKISLECRMSLYEGEYTGPWKPYSGSQLYASQAELKIANDNISSKVSKTDYTGATVASLINQSADSVKIQAKHVEIDGTTTFKDGSTSTTVADYVQGKVDDVTVGGRNLLAYSGLGRNWVYSSFADGVYTRATTATSESFITGSTVAPLELGETYTFSAWMKTNGQVASVEMFLYDNAGKTVRSKNLGGLTTDWKLYSWTVTMPDSWTSGTNTTQPWHARFDNNGSKTSGTNAILYVKGPKLEKGTKATDWTAAPEDVASNTQRIYYRSNSTTAPAAPTTWVTSTATANSTWSTKRMQYDATYKYLYTCVQMQNAAGMVYCTTVLLDDTTTVIDGGSITTGKVAANHIDVGSIKIGEINGGSTVVSNASAGKTASDKLGTTLEPISGARGNESTVTYVELCKGTIACNSNGASGSIHISGQIGGYVNTNQGHVDVTIGNRGTPPYAIAGQKDSTIDTTRGNIVAYYDSSYIVHVYLVMSATYCRYTLNMDNAIEFTRVNTTSTTAPSGTKFFDLSTATTEDSRTATDYITAIDSNGIRVHAASNPTSNYAKINADGMDVVKGGASVASFGEIARVGSEDSSRFVAAPSNMSMILASGAKVVDISSDGDEETISVEKMISSNRVPKGETGTRSVIVSDIPSWATTIMVLITDGSGNRSKRFASITSSLDFTYQNMRVVWTPSTKKIDYSLSTANNKTWTQAEVIVSGTKANISPTYLLGYGESTGAYSFVEGYGNTASGKYSHAEGLSTTASKPATHAEGYYTSATSDYAHSEGTHTEATGFASHAEGYYCQAKGTHSHAQNTDTIAASSDQTAIGKYNVSDAADTYALIVGNGTSDTARSNAMTVAWDGTLGLAKALPIASGGTGITNFLTTKDTNGPMTSVASATWTTLHSVSLEKGSWLVLVRCYCVSASGGTRQFTFSSSSSASAASFGESITIPAGTPGYQIYPMFVSPTATTTYYLRGYQSSGAALNMRGGFKAIKLG